MHKGGHFYWKVIWTHWNLESCVFDIFFYTSMKLLVLDQWRELFNFFLWIHMLCIWPIFIMAQVLKNFLVQIYTSKSYFVLYVFFVPGIEFIQLLFDFFFISILILGCPLFLTLSNNLSFKQQNWIKLNIAYKCTWSTVKK